MKYPASSIFLSTPAKDPRMRRKWRFLAWAAVIALIASLAFGFEFRPVRSNCDQARPARQIFEGIVFSCDSIEQGVEGGGPLYWARIDLTAPGIKLFVTPLDPIALAQGWQYRLRRVGTVVDEEHLAIAINGSLFTSTPRWRPRLPGDLARGVETTVSNHVVSHVWEHTYLLWFDDRLVPTLRQSKPPAELDLSMAKWGIGGQAVWLYDGKIWPGSSRDPDSRTAVGIDKARKLLFLAVGQKISPRSILMKLAGLGAKDGMLLDGGHSSSLAIGEGAVGVQVGTAFGGWRPVATQFGIRARSLH